MSLPRFTPGKPKIAKPKVPHGQSSKTLTIKVKAHTRKVVTPRAPQAPNPNAQPITPGSSITAGQAARMAANAVNVRYGPERSQLQQNIQHNTDLGAAQAGWYDQYLKQLEVYRQDAQDRATATNAAALNQANSIRGIDQQSMNTNGAQMAADAASRGATVGPQVAQNATNASLVRQGLEGSFGALLAARGSAAETQASNLAHVVGPGQKLQAQAGNARTGQDLLKQLADLKGQSGAYKQQFIDSLTQQEAKNILAASIAGQGYSLKAATLKETTRRDTLSARNQRAGIKAANGRATASQNAAANKVNQYGYTAAEWATKTPAQRQQIMAHVKAQGRAPKTPKTVRPTTGPGSVSPTKEASTVSLIHSVVSMIQRAPKVDSKGIKLTDHELRTRLASPNNPFKKIIDPRIVNIAFDIARNQGLTPPNVRAAHDLGIHVNGHFKILAPQPQSTVQPGIFTGGNPFLTP